MLKCFVFQHIHSRRRHRQNKQSQIPESEISASAQLIVSSNNENSVIWNHLKLCGINHFLICDIECSRMKTRDEIKFYQSATTACV